MAGCELHKGGARLTRVAQVLREGGGGWAEASQCARFLQLPVAAQTRCCGHQRLQSCRKAERLRCTIAFLAQPPAIMEPPRT